MSKFMMIFFIQRDRNKSYHEWKHCPQTADRPTISPMRKHISSGGSPERITSCIISIFTSNSLSLLRNFHSPLSWQLMQEHGPSWCSLRGVNSLVDTVLRAKLKSI
jgi:hypothetical protein